MAKNPIGRYWPRAMREAPPLPPVGVRGPIERRYALLVNPFYAKDPYASFGKHVLTPTLALTSVAGATPAHWRVAYWDENLLQGPPPSEPVPEVVGISVHLTFAERAYALARSYRALGSKVVFGGLHVLSCPDECAPHADALAIGEGASLWPEVLADVERGELKREYRADFRRPYREAPTPRRELLPRASFLTTASLIATRGCHNRCDFCYLATEGLRMPYQTLEEDRVAAEFAATGAPYAVFVDNNLGSRPAYLRRLCRALAPLEKIWSAAVTIDVTDDPSLVREMALAGCTGVFVGFESLNDDNLRDAGKKTPRADEYARRIGIFHEHGIQVNGSFVLGFDHDGPDVFERTTRWIETTRLECATFHILTPYPGTPLFRRLEAEGRLLHRDWSRYDTAHVVFRPARMTPDELERGYASCYEQLFSHGSIWRRRPRDWHALGPYLGMSYLYKRSNRFWHALIERRLTSAVWSPLVELTRRRHLRFRAALAASPLPVVPASAPAFAPRPSSAGPLVPLRRSGLVPPGV
ncbi:MAG: B12-binding domain-containing radical SAM protein [Polyangiaceae bacterium]|nr:B12-binding domain-containing radical SAM protein [Polyangiaceae bacterium]